MIKDDLFACLWSGLFDTQAHYLLLEENGRLPKILGSVQLYVELKIMSSSSKVNSITCPELITK